MTDFIGSLGQLLLEYLWLPIVVTVVGYIIQSYIKSLKKKKEEGQAIEKKKDKSLEACFRDLGEKRQAEILEKEYIPIKGQKRSPHNNKNLLEPASESERYDLVSTILSAISLHKKQRFTILAGNGMGKSIFAAALAKAYYKWDIYKNKELPYEFCVINLFGNDTIENTIKKKLENKDKGNMILVLDSLDENQEAMSSDRKTFIQKLEDITDDVQVVILLGRTQFFEKAEVELTEGSTAQSSDSQSYLNWERYYISPLTTDEMIKYVNTKYRDKVGTPEFKRAYDLVSMKNTDIMRRPLILSFLDDVVSINFVFPNNPTYAEIYHVVIKKWLKREARYNKEKDFLKKLYEFTKQIAVYIYENGFVLSKDEYEDFLKKFGYEEDPYAFKERSLLNRTDDGSIKFAHKSFLEYFLAIDSLEHPEKHYDPSELDMAKVFAQELQEIYLQNRRYGYIHMAESPFANKNLSLAVEDNIEDHKRDDFFDEWEEYIEDLSAEKTPEELRNTNLYFLRRYRNDLLFDVHVSWFIRREVKLHYITDKLAHNELNVIEKDIVENFKAIEIDRNEYLYFGSRLRYHDKKSTYTQIGEFRLSEINYPKHVIYPSIGTGILKPNEFAYAVGNGFVSSDEEVFQTIKRLINHKAEDITFQLAMWEKDKKDDKNPDATITVFPSVVLVYKEVQNISEQVEYIGKLQEFIKDLPLGKEIIIQFSAPNDLCIYYLLDYNSIIYDKEEIRQCLNNTIDAVKIGENKEKELRDAYNYGREKKPKAKSTNKVKKTIKSNNEKD